MGRVKCNDKWFKVVGNENEFIYKCDVVIELF